MYNIYYTDVYTLLMQGEQDEDTAEAAHYEFHINHGKNVKLSNNNLTAFRTASYNQGIVVTHKPLPRNQIFRVSIYHLSRLVMGYGTHCHLSNNDILKINFPVRYDLIS